MNFLQEIGKAHHIHWTEHSRELHCVHTMARVLPKIVFIKNFLIFDTFNISAEGFNLKLQSREYLNLINLSMECTATTVRVGPFSNTEMQLDKAIFQFCNCIKLT